MQTSSGKRSSPDKFLWRNTIQLFKEIQGEQPSQEQLKTMRAMKRRKVLANYLPALETWAQGKRAGAGFNQVVMGCGDVLASVILYVVGKRPAMSDTHATRLFNREAAELAQVCKGVQGAMRRAGLLVLPSAEHKRRLRLYYGLFKGAVWVGKSEVAKRTAVLGLFTSGTDVLRQLQPSSVDVREGSGGNHPVRTDYVCAYLVANKTRPDEEEQLIAQFQHLCERQRHLSALARSRAEEARLARMQFQRERERQQELSQRERQAETLRQQSYKSALLTLASELEPGEETYLSRYKRCLAELAQPVLF